MLMADSYEEEDTNVDIERNWFLITQVPGSSHSHRHRGHGHGGTAVRHSEPMSDQER